MMVMDKKEHLESKKIKKRTYTRINKVITRKFFSLMQFLIERDGWIPLKYLIFLSIVAFKLTGHIKYRGEILLFIPST